MTKFVAFLFALVLQTSFVFAEGKEQATSDQATHQEAEDFDDADLEIGDDD